jgi:hypothetical protein
MRNKQSDPEHFFIAAAPSKICLAASPIRRMPGAAVTHGGAVPQHTETIMTSKLLLPVMLVTALAAGTAGAAPEARTFHRSAAPSMAAADQVIVTAGTTPQPRAFLGNAAPAQAAADQVIVITDATRHVNVTGGQTVRFVVGERTFTWCFQNGSAHVIPFDLQAIAPQGLLNHRITTYVADNPLYSGT